MKIVYTFLIGIPLFTIATVARTDNLTKKSNCGESGGTMVEINACVSNQFKLADGELNRLYKEKMTSLETKESKDRLRDSQRAWVTFRDKACSYEADQFSDGSIWPSMHFGCMERHTQKRIDDLKGYLACDSIDCPN